MQRKRSTTETNAPYGKHRAGDQTIKDVCRERQIREQSFQCGKRELGIFEFNQAKQLKGLQRENARLKRMLAHEMLGKELLKEAIEKV
jgi:putative transposase